MRAIPVVGRLGVVAAGGSRSEAGTGIAAGASAAGAVGSSGAVAASESGLTAFSGIGAPRDGAVRVEGACDDGVSVGAPCAACSGDLVYQHLRWVVGSVR